MDGGNAMADDADAAIVTHGLRKSYSGQDVVAGVDLEVHRGEVFALLGPNGAGKTTTVEILEGIRTRSGGEARVLGEDPGKRKRAWRAQIGIVPQSTGAYLDLTVREVLAQFATYYPAPLPVNQVLEMVGLRDQAKKQCSALSGGQQRRLDVGVGVVGDPELIFLDEPTTGLDPVARREAWDLIRYFAERGKTTILTTHYLDEAEALADRAGIIVGGKVKAVGTIAELNSGSGAAITVSYCVRPQFIGRTAFDLPRGSSATAERDAVTISTSTPTEVLRRLLEWAHHNGVDELPELRVNQPSLEDIYLKLIDQDGQVDQ